MRMLLEESPDMAQLKQDFFELHLIADTGGRFSVVFEELKSTLRQIGIKPAGHAKTVVARIYARHLRFAFSQIEHREQVLVR